MIDHPGAWFLPNPHSPEPPRKPRISFLFEPADMWVGAFWDRKKRRLYILPLPCVGIVIQFKVRQQETPERPNTMAEIEKLRNALQMAEKEVLYQKSEARKMCSNLEREKASNLDLKSKLDVANEVIEKQRAEIKATIAAIKATLP